MDASKRLAIIEICTTEKCALKQLNYVHSARADGHKAGKFKRGDTGLLMERQKNVSYFFFRVLRQI